MKELLMRRNTVLEALKAGRRTLHQLWVQEGLPNKLINPILHQARKKNVRITETNKETISKLALSGDHQGVLLEVGEYPYAKLGEIFALAEAQQEPPFILLLDLIQGPQNVGTLLRTAEICGVHGVILQERRAPDITPLIVQYSAGAAEHLRVVRVTNLGQTIDLLKKKEVWIAGMDMGEDAVQLGEMDLNRPLGIVVGHEGDGLRRLIREKCDFIMQLPMRGQVESLNASIAGSVMLYSAWQARGFVGAKK